MHAIQGGIMKRTAAIVLGTSALLFASAALAQPNLSSRGGTMARALEATAVAQARAPQSRGLPKARVRLAENARKHAENEHGPRSAEVEQPQSVERVDRVERPQVALSPSVFERPLPTGLADRPLPRGLADRAMPRGLADRPQPVRGRGR
jgi:hypothetical protein